MAEVGANTRLLVFGAGHDSAVWARAPNRRGRLGRTLIVEDDRAWAAAAAEALAGQAAADGHPGVAGGGRARVLAVDYQCSMDDAWSVYMGNARALMEGFPAALANTSWDVIVVDGPAGGGGPGNPGRMKPIYWASQLVAPAGHVFVHDIPRPIELAFSRAYLVHRSPKLC